MGSVFLDNVNDFISPSQACVNPLFTSSASASASASSSLSLRTRTTNTSRALKETDGTIVPVGAARRTRKKRATVEVSYGRPAAGTDNNPDGTTNVGVGGGSKTNNGTGTGTVATVSVADCLACSGCVTSAEAVLVESHSADALRRECGVRQRSDAQRYGKSGGRGSGSGSGSGSRSGRRVVFTVSPACVADLTRHLYGSAEKARGRSDDDDHDYDDETIDDCSRGGGETRAAESKRAREKYGHPRMVLKRLATFLKHEYSASLVLDGTIPRDVSLLESAEEFCHRYRWNRREQQQQQQRQRHARDAEIDDEEEDDSNNNDEQGKKNMKCNEEKTEEAEAKVSVMDIDLSVPSMALSSTETRFFIRKRLDNSDGCVDGDGGGDEITQAVEIRHPPGRDPRLNGNDYDRSGDMGHWTNRHCGRGRSFLPMLTSSCPGFVCYVEKTSPSAVPNLGTARSPMATAGRLMKRIFQRLDSESKSQYENDNKNNIGNDNDDNNNGNGRTNTHNQMLYHVAIMPCHDKKLEAGRKDLAWEQSMGLENNGLLSDVDLVVTTTELLSLIAEAAAAAAAEKKEVVASSENGVVGASDDGGGGSDIERPCTNSAGEHAVGPNDNNVVRTYFDSLVPMKATYSFGPNAARTFWNGDNDDDDDAPALLLSSDSGRRATTTSSPTDNGTKENLAVESASASAGTGASLVGSGAYAEYIFRYASLHLFGHYIPDDEALPWRRAGDAAMMSSLSSSTTTTATTTTTTAAAAGANGGVGRRREGKCGGSNAAPIVRPRRRIRRGVRRSGSALTAADVAHSDLVEVVLYRREDGTYSTTSNVSWTTLRTADADANIDGNDDGVGDGDGGGGGTNSATAPLADGKPVLCFAAAYGFKNVQLVLQNLKRSDGKMGGNEKNKKDVDSISTDRRTKGHHPRRGLRYDFVEVMACPSGCLNGGGQIRDGAGIGVGVGIRDGDGDGGGGSSGVASAAKNDNNYAIVPVKAGGRRETPAQTRERVRRNITSMDALAPCPPVGDEKMWDGTGEFGSGSGSGNENGGIFTLLYGPDHGEEMDKRCGRVGSRPFGRRAREVLHTRFHVVPKLELTVGAAAGVALEDTKW